MNVKTIALVVTLALAHSVYFASYAQQPTQETKSCSSCGNNSCNGCKK